MAKPIMNFPRIKLVRQQGQTFWTVAKPTRIQTIHMKGRVERYEQARKFASDRNWKEGRL